MTYPTTYGYGTPGAYNQQQTMMPSIGYTPVNANYANPFSASPQVKMNLKEGKMTTDDYMKSLQTQQNWSNGLNAAGMAINAGLQIGSMVANYKIQSMYYNIQNRIADNQYKLGLQALSLEDKRLEVSRDLGYEQIDLQKRLARIQSQTSVAVAHIQEKGKSERAEIFSAFNAFNRRNYHTGEPMYQTGALT